MRTTVTLEKDVAAAIDHRRREEDKGISEVVNELVRKGLTVKEPREPFVQKSAHLGLKMNVDNIAEVLTELEGPYRR
jgi:metal-responsive CopG/Arc/MetJ family transcriptional regulator